MTKYKEIIQQLQQSDHNKAEQWEEEIDILIHKLKFLPLESFPKIAILGQQNLTIPLYNDVLLEKVKIAGGQLVNSLDQDPSILILIQEDESLYAQIGDIVNSSEKKFIQDNKIYIIQAPNFNTGNEEYIRDTEILAEIIQPKYFYFDREGTDWVKFDM